MDLNKLSFSRMERLIKPKQGSNRNFGLVFSIFFFLVAFLPLLKGHETRWWAAITGAVFLLLTLLYPDSLRRLNLLWFKFGLLLNRIMEPLIMTALFFLVITPFAFIVRLFKPDMLMMKSDKNVQTYWQKRDESKTDMAKQF